MVDILVFKDLLSSYVTFKQYLFEASGRSQLISDEEAQKLIQQNCSEIDNFYKNNPDFGFYRGIGFFTPTHAIGKYLFVDPKNHKRELKGNLGRLFIVMQNLSLNWMKYPIRDESIVFSSKIDRARFFGSGTNTYKVYPFDGAKYAICQNSDFNYTQYNIGGRQISLPHLGQFVEYVASAAGVTAGNDKPLWIELRFSPTIKTLQIINNRLKEYKEKEGSEVVRTNLNKKVQTHIAFKEFEFLSDLLVKNYDCNLLKFISEVIDPAKGFFTLATSLERVKSICETPTMGYKGDDPKFEREIWTDSPAVLVNIISNL